MSSAPEGLSPPRHRRLAARDAIICVGVASLLLLVFKGQAIERWGNQLQPGVIRTLVLAVGRPAAGLDRQLPFERAGDRATAWISPNPDNPGARSGFSNAAGTVVGGIGVPPVTPESFDPAALGLTPPPPRPLHTLLVTGDSLSMPLDVELARRLVPKGVQTIRDPHVGTGISKPGFVDWGTLSAQQSRDHHPDAVVVFIGANEGFPMPYGGRQTQCCGAPWAAAYADRVRHIIDAYRQAGHARVYWLTLPAPRAASRQQIANVVNAAIVVGAQAYAAQTRVLDLQPIFTPGGQYRDAMLVSGHTQIVREPDGIHLNDAGSQVAADDVIAAIRRDFALR